MLRVPRRSARTATIQGGINGNGRSLFFVYLFQLLFIQPPASPFNPAKRTCNKTNSTAVCLCHKRSFRSRSFYSRSVVCFSPNCTQTLSFFFSPSRPNRPRCKSSSTLRTNAFDFSPGKSYFRVGGSRSFFPSRVSTRFDRKSVDARRNGSSRINIFTP